MGVLSNIVKYNLQIHSPKEVYLLFRELKYNRFSISDKIERRLRAALVGKSLRTLYQRELSRYISWLAKQNNETDESRKIRDFDKNNILKLPFIKKKRVKLKYDMKGLDKRDYRSDNNLVIDVPIHKPRNQWVSIIYTPMGGQNKKY